MFRRRLVAVQSCGAGEPRKISALWLNVTTLSMEINCSGTMALSGESAIDKLAMK
jgi:hypothetical protein